MTVSDRTKDVIKSGGEWISSVELEGAVMAHPAVFEAAVVAVPDDRWQERPLCCVVLRPGIERQRRRAARLPLDEGREVVAARALGLHRGVPKTSVGKFDKKVLRAEYGADELAFVDARRVTSFDDLADEVAAVESRVADAIFDSVRAQLRDDDAEAAKELERRLSKVRRSLQKAEILLRGASDD